MKETNNKPFRTFQDYEKNWEDPEAMEEFCEYFLPSVVGRSDFQKLAAEREIRDFTQQPSDEGLVLLVLDNIWDDWIQKDLKTYQKNKVLTGAARLLVDPTPSPDKDDDNSSPSKDNQETNQSKGKKGRLYRCGKYTQNSSSATKFGGWSDAGLEQFSLYCTRVKECRERYPEFDTKYLQQKKKDKAGKKRSKKNEAVPKKKVKVYNDL